ncbi:hypothetical protein CRENBAI_015398 [Crenichthys baileyi]|uniref:Uncharacterized protein n=1 Tax=Crenichthys baileyi TaxID=28760 RepID=A0AAV9SR65_9TELE
MSITARTKCTHDTGMGKKRATNETFLDLQWCLQKKQKQANRLLRAAATEKELISVKEEDTPERTGGRSWRRGRSS